MRLAVATLVALLIAASPAANAAIITVTARLEVRNRVHLPPAGTAGDAEYARWIVRDRFGRTIGDLIFDCRFVTSSLRLCVGQLSLPLGNIALVGSTRSRLFGEAAVTGGTGRYVGANGTLTYRATATGSRVLSISFDQVEE